jgi:hypothetical protein
MGEDRFLCVLTGKGVGERKHIPGAPALCGLAEIISKLGRGAQGYGLLLLCSLSQLAFMPFCKCILQI